MSKYKLHRRSGVIDTETNANIPSDIRNKQWREYLEWRDQGNTPDPAETLEEKKDRKEVEFKLQLHKELNRKTSPEGNMYDCAMAIMLVDKAQNATLTAEENATLDALRNKFKAIVSMQDKTKNAIALARRADNPDNVELRLDEEQ